MLQPAFIGGSGQVRVSIGPERIQKRPSVRLRGPFIRRKGLGRGNQADVVVVRTLGLIDRLEVIPEKASALSKASNLTQA